MRPLYKIHRWGQRHQERKEGETPAGTPDYRAFFEAAPDPCVVLDRDLRIVGVNDAWLRDTKTRREEILGHDIFEISPDNPDGHDATGARNLRASLKGVLQSGVTDVMAVQRYDIRRPSDEGGEFEERYWSTINVPVLDQERKVSYILHRVRDITAFVRYNSGGNHELGEGPRDGADGSLVNMSAEIFSRSREVAQANLKLKQANEELVQGNQERDRLLLQLDSVLEGIKEGVIISDLEGNVLRMNRTALAMHEFESLEQVQRHLATFREHFSLSDGEGQELPLDQWPLARVLRGEEFLDLEVTIHPLRTDRRWIASYCGSLIRGRNGDPFLAVLSMRDITEKKTMQEELRFAKEQLQMITDTMPVGVLRCTRDRRCNWVSAEYARWLGKAAEDVVGQSLLEIVGKEVYDTLEPYIDRVLSGHDVAFENLIQYTGTEARWVSGRYTPTYDETGTADGWIAVIFDITERKEMEEQIADLNASLAARVAELVEANQELEGFNRMVSHDLRQPLNTIASTCQAFRMLCGDKVGEECARYLDIANGKVFEMSDLIDSLLNFSRSAHSEIKREKLDITGLAHDIARDLRLAEPGRQVEFKIATGLAGFGDPRLVRAALENLIGNAWKYTGMREDAVIEVGVWPLEGERTFFVKDNGRGFPQEEAENLFRPFKRLSGSEQFRGNGVGLATVERIIRRHGGRVWAEGAPDRGAILYFTLPDREEGRQRQIQGGKELRQ